MKIITYATAIITLIAGLVISQFTYAYDPIRSMKGSTIAGGSHYSRQTGYSAVSSVPSEILAADSEWSATISLPYNVNGYYEFADFTDVSDKVDTLVQDVGENNLSLARVEQIQKDAEQILKDFESLGSIINGTVITNGLFPVIAITHPAIKGTITFEHQGGLATDVPSAFSASFTSADLKVTPENCVDLARNPTAIPSTTDIQDCYNQLTDTQKEQFCPNGNFTNCTIDNIRSIFGLSSDATINLRVISDYDNYIFGYSTEVWRHQTGILFAGAKVSYTTVETVEISKKLTDTDDSDLDQVVKEAITGTNSTSSSGFGIDAGVSWLSARYQASFNLNNVSAPEIEYQNGDKVTHNIAPSIEGSFFLNASRSWSIRLQNDFAATKDLIGVEHQWRLLGISYTSTSWWIPGLELSKSWNLAGHELSYTNLGLQLFNILQMNVGVSDQSISGTPRSTIFSAGFGFSI